MRSTIRQRFSFLAFVLTVSAFPNVGQAKVVCRTTLQDATASDSPRSILGKQILEKLKIKKPASFSDFAHQRYDGFRDHVRYREYLGEHAYTILEELGPSFVELMVDPGVTYHIDGFADFIRSKKKAWKSGWAARQAFSEFLGSSTVYRALALSEEEYRSILERGINSLALERGDMYGAATNNIAWMAKRRVTGGRRDDFDPFLSTTKYPDVASAVAKDYARDGKSVYLFKLKIPNIDLLPVILPDSKAVGIPVDRPPYQERGSLNLYSAAGTQRISAVDENLEIVVFYKIGPQEIVSSRAIGTPPSVRWSY